MMTIFWRLVLAHFIADFTFQTNRLATWKRESKWGMVVHTLLHPVVSIALTWNYLSQPWVQGHGVSLNGWACVAIITIFHWLEDEWRVWSILKTGSPDSTGFFLWDQVVHLTIILAVSPVLPGVPPDTWMVPALCIVIVAHFISVLIFFIENDLGKPSSVLGDQKYRYMMERLFGVGLFLLPGYFYLVSFAWVGWLIYLRIRDADERSLVNSLIGNSSIVLFGILARFTI